MVAHGWSDKQNSLIELNVQLFYMIFQNLVKLNTTFIECTKTLLTKHCNKQKTK